MRRRPPSPPQPKRLYQIREGAIVSGVANGLAAYFNVDPTIVRVAWVVAAVAEMINYDRPPVLVIGLYFAARVSRALCEDLGRTRRRAGLVGDPPVQAAARRRKAEILGWRQRRGESGEVNR